MVSSDVNKGGTWTGAVEQLDKFRFVSVFVRSTGVSSAGLDALRKKGALPWPNPQDTELFEAVFNEKTPMSAASAPDEMPLFAEIEPTVAAPRENIVNFHSGIEPEVEADHSSDRKAPAEVPVVRPEPAPKTPIEIDKKSLMVELHPAEILFGAVRASIAQLLVVPMKDADVAVGLDVSNAQAKIWLQRLVDEGFVEKTKKPSGYIIKSPGLFE